MTPVSSRVSNCSLTAAEPRSNRAARPRADEDRGDFAELEGAVQRSLGKTELMMFMEFDQDSVLRKGDRARYCEDHAHAD